MEHSRPDNQIHACDTSISISVQWESSSIHQSMACVSKSIIPGHGYGLFLRPAKRPGMYFQRNTILCWYSRELLPPGTEIEDTDYAVDVDISGRQGVTNESVFNSFNVGRFAS